MEIKIPHHKHKHWIQIGGDMNPSQYGATIALGDGDRLGLIQIQPVREYVGDRKAIDVGHPFWSQELWVYLDDLDLSKDEVQSALQCVGLTDEMLTDLTPEQRALAIAEALLYYGRGDEGNAGFARDVLGSIRVLWWSGKKPRGWRYLADEDREFRRLVRVAK